MKSLLFITIALLITVQAQVMLPHRHPASPAAAGTTSPANPTNDPDYVLIYNGRETTGAGKYSIGVATSPDHGTNWTDFPGSPVITYSISGWDANGVFQPTMAWDGSNWVSYFTGWDGTYRRVGRAISTNFFTWAKYGSNPVISTGAPGSFDSYGQSTISVLYDTNEPHAWNMWYSGRTNTSDTSTTIGYAYSDDGLSWTKFGKVLDIGASGDFDDSGMASGCVVKLSSTNYYLYYSGYRTNCYRSGYATFSNPTNSYTKQGVFSGYDGVISFGGTNYFSNYIRSIINRGDEWQIYVTLFHTNSSGTEGPEFSVYATASDPASPGTNFAGPIIQLGSGWNALAAENPHVLSVPVATSPATGPAVFDGSNDYMQFTSSTPYGLADAKTFTCSFWVKFTDDGVLEMIENFTVSGTAKLQIFRTAANKIKAYAALGVDILDITGSTSITSGSGWTHIYMCFDLADTAKRKIYVNSVAETLTVTTYSDQPMDFVNASMIYTIGAQAAGTAKLNAALAELWWDNTYFDNPGAFVSGGQPADLGLDGSGPTGSQPAFYLRFAGNNFAVDSGKSGQFTVTGSLGTTTPP